MDSKTDCGAEGVEVIVGAEATGAAWADALDHGKAGRWVAPRFFRARRSARGETQDLGVYLVAGRAAGIYARLQDKATDGRAVSAPFLVRG